MRRGTQGRGRRKAPADLRKLEEELQLLKQRQAELRQQIRRIRNSAGEIRKLEEKLEKYLAPAKWIVEQIKQLRPDWDETRFYQSVQPRQPARRGRRPRAEVQAGQG